MAETTQKIRDEFGEYAERTGDEELTALVNDADRLQRAEELLKETRKAYIKDGTLHARKIDAYFGGHHDD